MLLESVLTKMVSEKVFVRIFMLNGYQMRGVISQADRSAVVLDSDGVSRLISVDAISTIEPMGPFKA